MKTPIAAFLAGMAASFDRFSAEPTFVSTYPSSTPSRSRRRPKLKRKVGYHVTRVRPAAPWLPNIKGMRFEKGVRVAR